MFLLGKGRTKEYLEAIRIIRGLAGRRGLDAASRAYAEAVAERCRKEFAESRTLREAAGKTCVKRLWGKDCGYFNDCAPPGSDHDSLWLKGGKPAAYLMQPYQLTFANMKALAAFCEKNKLRASVSTWPSYYFPDNVLSVLIERDEPEGQSREVEA